YDKIVFDKLQKWSAECTYEIPVVNECKVQPYKQGIFSYWESSDTYPDNKELYDSSSLLISPEDLPESSKSEFEDYHTSGISDENYIWKIDEKGKIETDFTCKPIRHYKFPDNEVAPFMWHNQQAPFSDALIFPLGVTINEEVINAFLDIAVKNSLITQ